MKMILKSNLLSLFLLLAFTFLLIHLTNSYILTMDFYENSGDPLSGVAGEERQVYENLQKWIYWSSGLFLAAKILMITIVLYTALFLSDCQVSFKRVLNVATWSEFVFFIPALIKVLLFHRYFPEGTLLDWHKFYVLSALSLVEAAPADYFYALQTLNVFEVLYWFTLAYGIYKVSGRSYDQALRTVLFYYVPALFIWVCVVTFCSLMIFPGTA